MSNKFYSVSKIKNHAIYKIAGIKFSVKLSGNIEAEIKESNHSYKNIIERIKNKNKIRVAFYVYEIAKWKTDSLIKLMNNSSRFEPFVVIGITPGRAITYTKSYKIERLKKIADFFTNKGIKVEYGYDINHKKHIPLDKFKPDIVFYQQHVGNCEINDVGEVSKYALCCYVPYNVPNYGYVDHDYNEFCAKLFRFYCLNESLKKYYEEQKPFAQNIKEVGHTALDLFYKNKNKQTEEKYIIYAPHFSIQHPNIINPFYYSTFAQNNKLILEYAKKHSEYTWVFKPHPNLKETLERMNLPQNIIEDYYNEWRNIGILCEDSDYFEYFVNSKTMLTDCGSFLTEYFCTGKPLIHMINTQSVNWPCKVMKPMYDCFYETHDNKELIETLDQIILHNNDYKKKVRQETLTSLNFINQNAAQNIMNDLLSLF